MRAKLGKTVLSICLVLGLLIPVIPVVAESPSTEILLEPTPVEVTPGNAFTVTLKIKNVPEPGMAAYDFRITFTPGVIEFAGEPTDHGQHEWPLPYGKPFVFHIDNSAGYIAFIDVFTDTTAPSGNITLAVLYGTTTESATTSLHFEKADIRYPDVSAIPATVTDGEVVISLPNSPPVLSGGAVSPASGYTSATFTYSVTYTDAENDTPSSITVSIDGGNLQNMTVKAGEDGDFTNGEIYQYTTTGANLGLGTHTFQFAASDGIDNAIGDIGLLSGPTVSSPPSPPPTRGGPGGGGGGAAGITPILNVVTEKGRFTEDVTAKSEDKEVELYIPKDTIGLNRVGQLISSIRIKKEEEPPAASADSKRIGLVYDIGPFGATFDPPIDLTLKYDESKIPEGVAEKNLVVATFDKSTSQWVKLESTVDLENDSVTAKISHFTAFTILAHTRPASFTLTDLSIIPDEVDLGESISISVLITNTGDLSGSYEVVLQMNDMVAQTKEVTLDGGDSETVSFSLTPDAAGKHTVNLNGLLEACQVKVPKAPATFTTSGLNISPAEVNIGESVTISVTVTNIGELTGSYKVSLEIDDMVAQTREVTLDGGASQKVVFTTAKDTAGIYTVDIDRLSDSFVVNEIPLLEVREEIPTAPVPVPTPAPTPTPELGINWPVIWGIIGGVVVVVGLLVFFWMRRRQVTAEPLKGGDDK